MIARKFFFKDTAVPQSNVISLCQINCRICERAVCNHYTTMNTIVFFPGNYLLHCRVRNLPSITFGLYANSRAVSYRNNIYSLITSNRCH